MAGDRLTFTKAAIEALPLPAPGKRKYYHDAKVRGLDVCVTASGKRTFYLSRWANDRHQHVKIGPFPDMSIEQARRKAEELNGLVAAGEDPSTAGRKRREEMTLRELWDWFLEHHAKPRKKTWREDERTYGLYLAKMDAWKLSRVTRGELRAWHAKLGAKHPYTANRALALVRSMFARAIAHEEYAGDNPAVGIAFFPEKSRDRRLSLEEIPRFLAALEGLESELMRDFFYMCLFTGQRKSNVAAMRWDEVDEGARTWRIPMTKNGQPQTVPLLAAEMALLARRREAAGSPWVFPTRSKTGHLVAPHNVWREVLGAAGLEDFRVHDLRRTLGSLMADSGAAMNVIGKALGHKSQAATAIYARLALDPVREAKERAMGLMGQG